MNEQPVSQIPFKGDWGMLPQQAICVECSGRKFEKMSEPVQVYTACQVCTEFGTIAVIPRKILYRVSGGKADRTRTEVPKTRYNE